MVFIITHRQSECTQIWIYSQKNSTDSKKTKHQRPPDRFWPFFTGFLTAPRSFSRKIHLSDKSRTLASDNLAHRLETFDISRLRRPISVPLHGDPGVILGWAILVGKRWWWVTRKPVNIHFCTWCWGWRKYFGGAIHLSCRYYKVRWTCCVKLS